MERHERLAALLELVVEKDSVKVAEIVEALDVSAATVRRDLDHLSKQQLLTRTRGGASVNPSSSALPFRYKASRDEEGIQRIAQKAASMVTEGEVVAVNGGTTTTEVARAIATDPGRNSNPEIEPIVIVTNAVNIANELAIRKSIRIVLTGGVVRSMSYELTGPLSTRILEDISIDTLFLGVNAINEAGAFAHHDGEASINAALVEHSHRVVIVCGAAKLESTAFAKICNLDKIDLIITEREANPIAVDKMRKAGIEIAMV